MVEISIIGVFIAGVLMFFAPCTLPLIPTFMAYLAGSTEPKLLAGQQRTTLLVHTVSYCLGFATVFISLGIVAGYVGVWLHTYKVLISQISGLGIIAVGLVMAGLRFPSWGTRSVQTSVRAVASPYVAYGIGFMFAIGWTPCVGPLLATILLLASSAESVVVGTGLLAVFSMGLALPFIVTALLYSHVYAYYAHSAALWQRIQFAAGIVLVVVGVLLFTNTYQYMIGVLYTFYEMVGFSSLYRFF